MARPKAVLFDFDGTLSTLRSGWEAVMRRLCLDTLCPGGDDALTAALVDAYIDESTGIQTIFQMEWLRDEAVRRGVAPPDADPWTLKEEYNRRLMDMVAARISAVFAGGVPPDSYRVAGAVEFIQSLREEGIQLFVASGTDEADVRLEADTLGLARYFDRIAGALPRRKDCGKEAVLRWLASEKGWIGLDLCVIGDGKVEIGLGKELGARTIGIAADETRRSGWDDNKRRRLANAGADRIWPDFIDKHGMLSWMGIGESNL
ncbi:MAG: HAD family hydrolase [Oscillospiraceae bacterium]|jgi:phosphoglycolate phosphatase-like HAD superfamily hydrolase|nr:HAD family hydrolase [Oscillospiraceae bacterium]